MSGSSISPTQLTWDQKNHPYSSLFNDHYYSLIDGLAESRHVFLQGNDLSDRWQQLSAEQTFCIMETGFGSALNFLATWQLWQNHAHQRKHNKLHYISIEAFPMTYKQLQKSLLNWKTQLADVSQQLLDKYPPLISGHHQLLFEEDNIELTLIFADIREQLPTFKNKRAGWVDAWFLDGFSPAKNPQMWESSLYTQMHRLSKENATVATYTVAGMVRRGLTAAGFNIQRKPGFGTKRDMLIACLMNNQPMG